MKSYSRSLVPLFAILILGFVVRLFAYCNTCVVNPDGPLYIHQARAIYFGHWDQIGSCALTYVSPYPFFIAGVYYFVNDWIASARGVSLVFGTMTLLPLYLLLRRFTARTVSLVALLIFALIPTLVDASADIIKEPVAWPFLGLGLYFFVRNLEESRGLYLVLSSICLLAASAERVEFLLFLIVSFFFLLFSAREDRGIKVVCFLVPVALSIILALAALKGMGVSLGDAFRLREVLDKPMAVIEGYRTLRQDLGSLMRQPVMGPAELFLERSRGLVWFIGLGTLASFVIKTFFYPFFIPFVMGLPDMFKRSKTDSGVAYLLLLSLSAAVLLYFHLLQTWVMGTRFVVLFIFPSFICIAYGMEKILAFFQRRRQGGLRAPIVLICSVILVFGVFKNLGTRESDKIVFKQIGEFIAQREGNDHIIQVASSLHLLRWVSFYSNLGHRGAPCPQPYPDFASLVGADYDGFLRNLKRNGFKYFVWEERHWPAGTFNFRKEVSPEHFRALGSWSHPDSGKIILYQLV